MGGTGYVRGHMDGRLGEGMQRRMDWGSEWVTAGGDWRAGMLGNHSCVAPLRR